MSTDDDSQRAMFYLSLGVVAGSLMEKDRFLALVQALRAGDVNPAYVLLVREKLDRALEAASHAAPELKQAPIEYTRSDRTPPHAAWVTFNVRASDAERAEALLRGRP
jgi:hypothetical protein